MSTSADPLERLGLTRAQTAVYETVLRLHRATLPEIAEAADEPADEVAVRLAGLVRLGAVDEQAGEYLARHPAAAIGRLIAARLDRLAEESRQIDAVLASVGGLTLTYDAGRDYQDRRFPVELVNGADELYESVIGLALQSPPSDLVTAIPDERSLTDFIRKYADTWIEALKSDLLSARAVIPASALAMPGMRDSLDRLAAAGAGIRVLDRIPSWFFAIGHDAAGLPADWGVSLPGSAYNCYLVRAPIVVGALRALFDEMWQRAVPVRPAPGAVQVLRLASQGISDDTIARRLGVSVRTVRARFADAMAELGAQTRFQAGVEAARRGWLS
ncbi:LuxR family transcriptional regulator [Herbidospora sp. NEAU-GS84]|uniref:LuxR family transcriptional regulator n=1 Tax=Herbidospora solisilvae TaxID=2696284 RepID=A0A7C9J5X0_9ACTN|nr:LuxR family transcriptional regulator [Herbidospora solisilvae]NAS25567.1 LuxR family transcriptional regulator [Herbidospora solisilvae]